MAGERLLADTHTLLWIVQDPGRFRPRTARTLDDAVAGGRLHASVVSFYEIGLLVRRGRLRPLVPPHAWPGQVASLGIAVLALDAASAVEAANLTAVGGDPFDELLVATARVHGLTLATRDGAILDYGARGHVRTLEV